MTAMQMVTVQLPDLRPNSDGSVRCAGGPLIRVLHVALMTDRGADAEPVGPAPFVLSLLATSSRWLLASPLLEESVGRHSSC